MTIDIADLQRKSQAAREFTVSIGAASYTLRLPTRHETEMEILRSRGAGVDGDLAQPIALTRKLLERAVVGWSGVTLGQLAPAAGPDPADYQPEAVALLLDQDTATAEHLLSEFVKRAGERNARTGAAEKN